MRTLFHPNTEDIQLTSVLYALSDPTRLKIFAQLLQCSEFSCGELELSLPKSTVSHHFKVLRESGLIRTRIAGTQRFMSLRKEDIEKRFPGLIHSVANAIVE